MTDPSERNSYGLTWDEEKALHAEMLLAANREANEERERANKAVQAALSGYRWWGWTNIINTIRIFVQARRAAARGGSRSSGVQHESHLRIQKNRWLK